jgi:hypothetical protein
VALVVSVVHVGLGEPSLDLLSIGDDIVGLTEDRSGRRRRVRTVDVAEENYVARYTVIRKSHVDDAPCCTFRF